MLGDRTDVLEWQRLKVVRLEKIVQILLEHLEHQAGVVLVREAFERPYEVVVVRALLGQTPQNGDLDLSLPRIGRVVLQDLDGHNFVGALLPAFHHLACSERAGD